MPRPVDCRVVGSGGMWGTHLLRMLRFWLPLMSVPMGWSRRVGGEVFGRWFHCHKNEGWRYHAIKSTQSCIQVFGQNFWLTIGKRCLAGTPWLLFEGGPFWKTSTQTRSTLVSEWLPNFHNVQNLVVISDFTILIFFICKSTSIHLHKLFQKLLEVRLHEIANIILFLNLSTNQPQK